MAFNLLKLKRGISTVELLLAAFILVMVFLVAGNIFIDHIKLFSRGSALLDITSTNKIALDEIVNGVRESQSVVNSCAACGSDTTGASLLILKNWPLDASGNPVDLGSYDYVVYKRDSSDNTKIRKITYPTATSTRRADNRIIGTNISSLSFTYDTQDPAQASDVIVKVKNTVTVSDKTQDVEREAKAVMRNK